ncbi:hypothetical protein [Rhabdothermincola salaria]|uniref:hypothetical protein n=1 Tax=Rhabdothermincola salaria TaxID=2903142 RepID=UPI001E3CF0D4|nr:hypothetical protein [Rhabdothermincola salaria]MCD9625225.1 hypothetical protein [Rhabdothermincola salaria]
MGVLRRSRTDFAWAAALVAVLVLVLAVSGLTACGGSDRVGDDGASVPPASEIEPPVEGQPTTGASAFCEQAPDPAAEVPASYVGSTDHVEDLRRLRTVAPDVLGDDLDIVIRHFDESVDPSDPDSQLMENFPDEVNEASGRLVVYIEENCSTPEPGSGR